MALIECPECGNMLSDKAKVCPNCGYDQTELITEYVWCPACMCHHVYASKKGFSGSKAAIGSVIGGTGGAIIGATDGMNEIIYSCERCGCQFSYNECFKGKKTEAESFEAEFVRMMLELGLDEKVYQYIMSSCHITHWNAIGFVTNYTNHHRDKFKGTKAENDRVKNSFFGMLGCAGMIVLLFILVYACS